MRLAGADLLALDLGDGYRHSGPELVLAVPRPERLAPGFRIRDGVSLRTTGFNQTRGFRPRLSTQTPGHQFMLPTC